MHGVVARPVRSRAERDAEREAERDAVASFLRPWFAYNDQMPSTTISTPLIDSFVRQEPVAAPPPPSRERAAAAGTRSSGRERKAARRSGMLSTGEALDFRRVGLRRRLG